MSRSTTKSTKLPVCAAKTLISMTIHTVWSVFAVRLTKHWILTYPLGAQRRLIRLGGCTGWSESSLGAHAILLVLSCCGSYIFYPCCPVHLIKISPALRRLKSKKYLKLQKNRHFYICINRKLGSHFANKTFLNCCFQSLMVISSTEPLGSYVSL